MAEVTVSGTWKSAQPVATNILVNKVIDTYGLAGDDESKRLALECLDETVKELNMQVWEFNLVTATGITLAAGTRAASDLLPTLFYKEKLAHLVGSDGNAKGEPLAYVDWATFERLYLGSGNGQPRAYSVKNQARDGQVYLGPTPNDSTDTLTVHYYRRIELPSTTSQLVVPEELENVILYGAKKRFAILIEGPDSDAVARFHQLEQGVFEKMQAADRRHPDELTRFRLYPFRTRRYPGSLYIKVT